MMMKYALAILIPLAIVACEQDESQNQKDTERYTQHSDEIDSYKKTIRAYEDGNWEIFVASFSDSARIYHNTENNFLTPAELVAAHQRNLEMIESYELLDDKEEMEMVVNDDDETWVNYWGVWSAKVSGSGNMIELPIHLTAQFENGKIKKEYGYYDNSIVMAAMEEPGDSLALEN
ncbi:nuclear transport factor 2 family protein [Gramella sp. AN32]|uniref:Nuclear transport factor 2 family protein n=1 Tax=Christiangramia antarctica TaxID=2058158 RepID=A0ABW5X997_9FLAO|nr:nuclear transport factor 2 family protein [Gramella sp. AN32]MCM4158174.1 hypothetical protein [Gramella sp. AN32]